MNNSQFDKVRELILSGRATQLDIELTEHPLTEDDMNDIFDLVPDIRDNIAIYRVLINHGVDVNGLLENLFTDADPSHDTVKFMIESGANAANVYSEAMFSILTLRNANDLFILMNQHGANLNMVNDESENLLHVAAEKRAPNPTLIRTLVQLGVSTSKQKPNGDTPLIVYLINRHSVEELNIDIVTELLIPNHGDVVNKQSRDGETALMSFFANLDDETDIISSSDRDIFMNVLNVLLNAGANVNLQNSAGYTVLHYILNVSSIATPDHYGDILKAIIGHGADLSIKNMHGETAISLANKLGNSKILDILNMSRIKPVANMWQNYKRPNDKSNDKNVQYLPAAKSYADKLQTNIMDDCCKELKCIYCDESHENSPWVIAVLHKSQPTRKFMHCMYLQHFEEIMNNTDKHILRKGSYKCPECRYHDIKWSEISKDLEEFYEKGRFGFVGYRSSNSKPYNIKGKVTHIFKCPKIGNVNDDDMDNEPTEMSQSRKRKAFDEDGFFEQSSENGYKVNQSSWDMFLEYITSSEELSELSQDILWEICRSLNICKDSDSSGSAGPSKTTIIDKLVQYFNDRKSSFQELFVPQDLATVYCSNPRRYCINNIPQDLGNPAVQKAWLDSKRLKRS